MHTRLGTICACHGSTNRGIPVNRPLLLALNSGEDEAQSLAAYACIDRGERHPVHAATNSSIEQTMPSAVEN